MDWQLTMWYVEEDIYILVFIHIHERKRFTREEKHHEYFFHSKIKSNKENYNLVCRYQYVSVDQFMILKKKNSFSYFLKLIYMCLNKKKSSK